MDTYRCFIDEVCELARRSTAAARIRRHGHAERPNWREVALPKEEQARMDFVRSLDATQREMLAGLLEQERIGAVHDVLAHLEWKVSADSLELGANGVRFADVARETLQGDFMARLADR